VRTDAAVVLMAEGFSSDYMPIKMLDVLAYPECSRRNVQLAPQPSGQMRLERFSS
jgi:hypothetical protein